MGRRGPLHRVLHRVHRPEPDAAGCSRQRGDYEVGWRLAREAWGHGYATEAGTAALEAGLGRLRLRRIWSLTAHTNTASQAVMERLGLVRHSDFEHPGLPAGHPLRPHVAYRTPPESTVFSGSGGV